MKPFGQQMADWCANAKIKQGDAVRAVCLQLTEDVILRTPVDTGRARGNWQASIDRYATETVELEDKTGAQSLAKAQGAIAKAPGSLFYLINNLPYIRRLEYEGWSSQAPQGMVRVSVQNIRAGIDQLVKEAAKNGWV